MSVQFVHLYYENGYAQAQSIQYAPILSQWSPSQGNGWFPQLSPNGRYVAYGFGGSFIADIQANQERTFGGSGCFGGWWIQPDMATFNCETNATGTTADRYEVKVGQWTANKTSDDPNLVSGVLRAADGHWASGLASNPTRISKDNQLFSTGNNWRISISGNNLATGCLNGDETEICLWESANQTKKFTAKTPNFETILKDKYIAYGGFGPVRGICLDDNKDIDLTATSSRQEHIGQIIMVNSRPWIVTMTETNGISAVLLRPWGERSSIVINAPTGPVSVSTVYNNGIFTVAFNDNTGKLSVVTVSDTAPRNDLSGGLAPETCGVGAPVVGTPVNATAGWRGQLDYNPTNDTWLVVSDDYSGGQGIIWGRIMANNQTPITAQFSISGKSNSISPHVAYDKDKNRYLAVWIDLDTSQTEIFGRFINSDGSFAGNPFLITRDFTDNPFFYPNAPLRYDSVNKKFVLVWENRSPNIDIYLRTINPNTGQGDPTIKIVNSGGIIGSAPSLAINEQANEYCIAYHCYGGSCTVSPNSSATAIRRVDPQTGQVGQMTLAEINTAGEVSLAYNSTDNQYLATWKDINSGPSVKGKILSSCDGTDASSGSFMVLNDAGSAINTYNPTSNTYAVVAQDQSSIRNRFGQLDNRGVLLTSSYIFTDGTNGNYSPFIAPNTRDGKYAAISSKDYAMVRFLSNLGVGSLAGLTAQSAPTPCDPSLNVPGYMITCNFSPSTVAPGGTVQVAGFNLATTVLLTSAAGTVTSLTGSVNSSNAILTFTVPSSMAESEYEVTIEGNVTQIDGKRYFQSTYLGTLTVSSVPTTPNQPNQPVPILPFQPNVGISIPPASNFQDLINNAVKYSLYVIGIAVFIVFLWAGFLWMTSAANPGNIATAKSYMFNAVVGAVLLASSYVILYTINPELVGGGFNFQGIGSGPSGQSLITQPTCDNGFCSNNSSKACTQNTDCNVVCINNVCNNGTIGACTLDTDCQIELKFVVHSEAEATSAFAAGCSRTTGSGYQDFSAVECPDTSANLTPDTVFQLQDTNVNNQIGATITQTTGNKGQGTRIVILDTGYNYNHPELQSSYLGGWDFVNNDNDPMDDHIGSVGAPGHGSHVAGIITSDGIDPQSIGVAPNSNIISGKILDSNGAGSYSAIINGIYWAINGPDNTYGTSDDFDPDAINISIGGGTYANLCDNMDATALGISKAIQYAKSHGVLVVIAAGNNPAGVSLPGCLSESFTVGAIDSNNLRASFSGLGAGVDITAPGVNLYSSILGNSYGTKTGTSMATPVVSGVVALIKSAFPNYTVDQVEQTIINSAVDLGSAGKDAFYGWGKISANAMQGISTCSGACANITATPASCTKNVTISNPNCNITLNYSISGITAGEAIIKKNGIDWASLSGTSGSRAESNPPAGTYSYTLNNRVTGASLSSTVVNIYYQGSLSSPWLACTKGLSSTNPNCDVTLNYTLGTGSGNSIIYKDGFSWQNISPPSGSVTDTNVSAGTHTYTLRDSSGSTQISRVVIRIEGPIPKPRIITSISPSSAKIGQVITINGSNLGNALEVARKYFTVQVHDKNRVRNTTTGKLDPSNTLGTWKVDPVLTPGEYTIRVGPLLNDTSNEVRFTVIP
ncbi:MAG: hypothetical protein A3B91_01470 [Candidatus Yanofskybacteria bacterium RIFCSPHIGHO2_02_FULL_41_29]|uniref:Peptidase S8/S53 domain-containing protein n=1 Tax=Candidatus Yanofskybacteria bacterium RIFCSPHIGHO2_01_FULL_41_53 TaxID=1802663 RepID=A0A1F8EFR7_9BACT|nr:MAG: hypothetical protein A2650_00890 [Candidatus Yanofskybacteria bacterium RIFCSPHIGHO2_01_FULL_41_53]OGN11040.1 MAG: hypothetical protein A3B91_01470 [Candidatus Yanofskybacteria bacterium RIFCSPHIGHO2_02_FULL_41_29]OGN30232.1 MAG: hypothetical protein A3H54_02595 [Candidatus Yanofskybacteria bacterium RIFCSPLOWO2_02_FULL_41_13]